MPNRDGLDTRHHVNRQVGYNRWIPNNNAAAPEGSLTATSQNDPSSVSATPQPWGWEAGHERVSRTQAFEQTAKYEAGPFKSEHRAKAAALAMSQRSDDSLNRYKAGTY